MTVAEPGAAVLESVEERILRWLDDQYEPVTSIEIGEAIGATANSVNRYLVSLEGQDLVIRVGRQSQRTRPALLWVSADRRELRDRDGSRARALAWLRQHGEPATQEQIAEGAGYTWRTVSWALRALVLLRKVECVGKVEGMAHRPPKLWRACAT